MSRTVRTAAAAFALAIMLATAGPAAAYRFSGAKWPVHTITYHNSALPNAKAVANAVYAWNTSGANIRFVPTSRANAQVIIENIRPSRVGSFENLGIATTGWAPPTTLWPNPAGGGPVHGAHVWLVAPSGIPDQDRFDVAEIAAHELGHVIGLGHETRGCATMNPIENEFCHPPHPWQENCRVLETDDIRGAIALYGGSMRKLGPEFCDVARKPSAPTHLTAGAGASASAGVSLSWTNPGGVTVNPSGFELSDIDGRPSVEHYFVSASQSACPANDGAGLLDSLDTGAGLHATAVVHVPTVGRWCFTVYVDDAFERFGAPAHLYVDVAP